MMPPALSAVAGGPRLLLRAEGAAMAAAGIALFAHGDLAWWWFLMLLLAPDLSFLGYLAGPKVGAAVYNAVHTTLGPLATLAVGWLLGEPLWLSLGGIWLAHVGIDRLLGYGLKYASGFDATHLGKIGRQTA